MTRDEYNALRRERYANDKEYREKIKARSRAQEKPHKPFIPKPKTLEYLRARFKPGDTYLCKDCLHLPGCYWEDRKLPRHDCCNCYDPERAEVFEDTIICNTREEWDELIERYPRYQVQLLFPSEIETKNKNKTKKLKSYGN